MLVLSRRVDERIFIGEDVTLMVVEIKGDVVKLGFEGPDGVSIDREEVRAEKIRRLNGEMEKE